MDASSRTCWRRVSVYSRAPPVSKRRNSNRAWAPALMPDRGGRSPSRSRRPPVLYCEQTGTSMSAPHVSGAVAAFLSVRSEFIGQPERVKELFLSNAVDLGRQRHFQGAGLLDPHESASGSLEVRSEK